MLLGNETDGSADNLRTLVYAPTIWNKLPQDLRRTDTREQCKRSLKSCDDSSVRTAGDASDRHRLKARRIHV